jgi:type IV pilus assembly protein PilX
MKRQSLRMRSLPKKQGGIALIIALIILGAMLMGGIAMMRSVDSGVIISGNIALRQAAVAAADSALEQATRFVQGSNADALRGANIVASGYYASHQGLTRNQLLNLDTFTNANAPTVVDNVHRLTARYLIHRMCPLPGTDNGCNFYQPPAISSDPNCKDTNCMNIIPNAMVLFRVTVLVEGPRNSRGVVQTFVTLPN